jgi:hypothetical protein
MRLSSPGAVALCLACLASANTSVGAQDAGDAEPLRRAWGGHAGLLLYGTGADENCAHGAGFSVGVEFRTRGRWFAAVGADALLASPFVCTDLGVIAQFRGEIVEVSSGTQLFGAPRMRVRAGRALTGGGWSIEPTVGGGLIYSWTDFRGDPPWMLNAWFGGSITVRTARIPVGIEFEYGRHQVPIRYYDQDAPDEIVHEFRRWKPVFRMSIVL